jgi:hypothetical protein
MSEVTVEGSGKMKGRTETLQLIARRHRIDEETDSPRCFFVSEEVTALSVARAS